MQNSRLNVVTGAFGYTGKYITQRLLHRGERVATLTGHPEKNPFGERVVAHPFNFENPVQLRNCLKGASVLYNTYWIRFPRGELSYERAVGNTKILIQAAAEAGIRRLVHISITNADENSSLPYFRGKGRIENAITRSGLSYAIIRPTIIFGNEDILINNIAWLLRKFPVFAVIGSGDYKVRPVFVDDVAEIAVSEADDTQNVIIDAVGPEIYTFEELVLLIANKVGSRAKIIHTPLLVARFLSQLIGRIVKDVLLTKDEVDGLTAGLLHTESPATGDTRLSKWLERNSDRVGARYASELERHFR